MQYILHLLSLVSVLLNAMMLFTLEEDQCKFTENCSTLILGGTCITISSLIMTLCLIYQNHTFPCTYSLSSSRLFSRNKWVIGVTALVQLWFHSWYNKAQQRIFHVFSGLGTEEISGHTMHFVYFESKTLASELLNAMMLFTFEDDQRKFSVDTNSCWYMKGYTSINISSLMVTLY